MKKVLITWGPGAYFLIRYTNTCTWEYSIKMPTIKHQLDTRSIETTVLGTHKKAPLLSTFHYVYTSVSMKSLK